MKKWIDTRLRTRNRNVCGLSKTGARGIWSVVLVEDDTTTEFGSLDWPSVFSGPWPYRRNGEESYIQRTWKLAKQVSSPHQVITVMDQAHWGYAWKLLIQETLGRIVWQPENRGDALGVFLPLSYIRFHDPEGIVIVWFVKQAGLIQSLVLDSVQSAVKLVDQDSNALVGVAGSAGSNGVKEGWECLDGVQTGKKDKEWSIPQSDVQICVAQQPSDRDGIMGEGRAVGVLVARVEALWLAGRRFMPRFIRRLDALGPVLGTSREQQILRDLYQTTSGEILAEEFFPFLGSQLEILVSPDQSHHRERYSHS
ncbi:MAG: hypothetical protein R3B74_16305 [Nitrospirales bacterium]|nr:hypothetical protein [Nitrospirales bacterium]